MGAGISRRALNRAGARAGIITQKIPIRGLQITNIDGLTGVAWGTAVLQGLREGNLLVLGAVLDITLTEASANITDTFDGDVSVGSAPTADTTLSGAEVDVIPSTAMGAAVSSVNTIRAVSTSTECGTVLDNTGGTLELNLNLLIDDASINADDQVLTADGYLAVSYIPLGDD